MAAPELAAIRPGPPERRTRLPGELPFAVLFLAFALFLWWHLGTEARWLRRLPWFQQPALWPSIAIYAMLGFGALNLALTLRQAPSYRERPELWAWIRALEFAGWYLAYAYAVPILGYLPATVLAMVALVWRLGLRSPGALAAAAAFGLGVVLLFKTALRVGIPGGQLYALFPPEVQLFLSIWF